MDHLLSWLTWGGDRGLEIRQHSGIFKAEEVFWGCERELWEYIVGVPKCQLSCSHFCHVPALKWLAQDFPDVIPKFWPLHLAVEVSMDLKVVSAWIQGCVRRPSGYLGPSQRPEASAGLKPNHTRSWFLVISQWLLRKKQMWFCMSLRLRGKNWFIYCPLLWKSLPCSFQAISCSFLFLAHVIEETMNPFFSAPDEGCMLLPAKQRDLWLTQLSRTFKTDPRVLRQRDFIVLPVSIVLTGSHSQRDHRRSFCPQPCPLGPGWEGGSSWWFRRPHMDLWCRRGIIIICLGFLKLSSWRMPHASLRKDHVSLTHEQDTSKE